MINKLFAAAVLVACVYFFTSAYGDSHERMNGMTSDQRYQAELLTLEAQKLNAQSFGIAAIAVSVATVCVVALALSFKAGQDQRQKHHDQMLFERSKRRPEHFDISDENQLMETGSRGQVTLTSIRKHADMTRLIRQTVKRTGSTNRENVMNAIRESGVGVDSNVFSPAWRECIEAHSVFAQMATATVTSPRVSAPAHTTTSPP